MLPSRFRASLAVGMSLFHLTAAETVPNIEDCDISYAAGKTYGKSSGYHWCASRIKQGDRFEYLTNRTTTSVINGIKMYGHDGRVFGIEVRYTNNDFTMIGSREVGNGETDFAEMDWDPTENTIAAATGLLPNDLQGIMLKLSDGTAICVGQLTICSNQNWERPSFPQDYATGPLLGIQGWYGSRGIEKITFQMLGQDVKSAKIHDVQFSPSFEELNNRASNHDKGLFKEVLIDAHYVNDHEDEDMIANPKIPWDYMITKNWTHTKSDTWHTSAGVQVEYGNGAVASRGFTDELEFFWQRKQEIGNTNGEKHRMTGEIEIEINLKPGQAVHIKAIIVKGIMDLSYKAITTVTLASGDMVNFPIAGTFKAITYSEVWSWSEDEYIAAARLAISRGDVQEDVENGDGTLRVNEHGGNPQWPLPR